MNLETSVTLGQLMWGIGSTLVVSGIAWGSLLQRVRTLEKQIEGLPDRLTRVETIVEGIQDDVTEIKDDVKVALKELRSFAPDQPPRRRQS